MTTLVLNENGTVQFPANLLKLLGWKTGSRLEIKADNNAVTLVNQSNVNQIQAESTKEKTEFEKKIDEAFGMVTVDSDKKRDLLNFVAGIS